MKTLLILLLLIPAIAAGQDNNDKGEAVFGDAVIATIELTFTPNGVTGKVVQVQYGTPTSSISRSREYLVEALGQDNKALFTCSIHDPLMVYLDEGPDDNAKGKADKAVTYVHVPYSDNLRGLRIQGQTPETKDVRANLDLADQLKEAFRQFRSQ